MSPRRFEPSDLADVNGWHVARGLPAIAASSLPATGCIVPGVAVGFLYVTDSDIGFLDGFISNPAAPSADRAAALLSIADELVKAFRGRHLLVYTAHEGIARWSRKHDFAARGSHQLFTHEKEP